MNEYYVLNEIFTLSEQGWYINQICEKIGVSLNDVWALAEQNEKLENLLKDKFGLTKPKKKSNAAKTAQNSTEGQENNDIPNGTSKTSEQRTEEGDGKPDNDASEGDGSQSA